MANTNEVVKKINSCYVEDNCVQISYPYNDCITILNKNGILYHHKINSNFFINKYLSDERRRKFPYHTIPTFYAKNDSGFYKLFTNQIFNFNQPYIIIKDNQVIENYVVKDGTEALIISKQLTPYKKTSIKNRKEVEEILCPSTSIRYNLQNIYLSGAIPEENLFEIDDEDTIIQSVKDDLKNNLIDFKEYIRQNPSTSVSKYLKNNPLFLSFIEQNLSIENIKNMDLNKPLLDDEMVIIAKTDGDNIELIGISITFIKKDQYKVDTYTIPINKYTYEQIKFLTKQILDLGHPNIQLKHNPGVTKQDIESAKQMIYSKKRK